MAAYIACSSSRGRPLLFLLSVVAALDISYALRISMRGARTGQIAPTAFLNTPSPAFLPKTISRPSSLRPSAMRTSATSPLATTVHRKISKRTLDELGPHDLSGKRVLVRCDLNVPMDGTEVADDTRLRASVKTIQYLTAYGAKVILASHFGRPKGHDPKYSLELVRGRMQELLQADVKFCEDCVGEKAQQMARELRPSDVLLLENVRFHPEETKNDPEFAKSLASIADMYVNDAFGAAHRAHASTAGVAANLKPAVAGFLLEKEIAYLSEAIEKAERPFAAIIGGSKVSTKIGVLEALLNKVDKLIIGGGMAFTFLKARGLNVGASIVEDDKLAVARNLEKQAAEKGVEFILPTDVVIADKFHADAKSKVVKVEDIPDGWWALDNGPDTTDMINRKLDECKCILWNGPMGVAEFEQFAAGTIDVAKHLATLTRKGVTTIVGGGDSVAAAEKAHVTEFLSHVSTGGGASLELLEGKKLPGVEALDARIPPAGDKMG